MAEKNSRGFEVYGDVVTDHGHTIRVYESSAASAPHVWINTARQESAARGQEEGTSVHLSLVQAIRMRGLLDEFIEGVANRWENGARLVRDAEKLYRATWPRAAAAEDYRSCQCCRFGNHDFTCVCDGEECCHPHKHAEQRQNAAVSALHAWVGAEVPRGRIEAAVARLKARKGVLRDEEPVVDACMVPWCGHPESEHDPSHCRACHRQNDDHSAGKCLHVYFPVASVPEEHRGEVAAEVRGTDA